MSWKSLRLELARTKEFPNGSPAHAYLLHLPLDDSSRARAVERFDALLRVVAPDAKHVRLPVCTDRDDQKFLEIARDAEAQVLITKDKALLKLARRTAREGLFKIMLPEAWLKAGMAAALE